MKSTALLSFLGILSLVAPARAVLVIDSFTGSTSGASAASGPTASFFFGFNPFPDRETAFTITTGNNDSYFNELKLVLFVADPSSPLVATLSTGPSAPGGVDPVTLGSFSTASNATNQTATFAQPANTILLTANTTYWIHLTVPTGGGIFNLSFTDTPIYSDGFSLSDTWAFTPASDPPPNGWNQDGTSGVARIQLDVSPVPEPTAVLLGGLGMLLVLRRRR